MNCLSGPSGAVHFRRGLDLLNRGRFFDAHEVLEDVWREAPSPERKFLQGLIQVAVALHHHSRGNVVGCRSVLARAARNLSSYSADHGGVDLASLRAALDAWLIALNAGKPTPPPPTVIFRE